MSNIWDWMNGALSGGAPPLSGAPQLPFPGLPPGLPPGFPGPPQIPFVGGGSPGLPGMGGVPGLPYGIGSIPTGPGDIINGVGQMGSDIANAFSLPGGHTDGDYNMFVAQPGDPNYNIALGWKNRSQDQGGGGMFDPNYNMARPTTPFYSPPPIAEPTRPKGGIPPIAEPRANQMGTFAGGWGNGAGSRQWETSNNGGRSWFTGTTNTPATPLSAPSWTQTGDNSFTRRL